MNIIFFCQRPYALAINKPIHDVALKRGHRILWYIPENVKPSLDFSVDHTGSMTDLINFKPDAIIAPGNEVPHFLRGVKVQIFHGLAGEKKGHFHIRHYFDLYLTPGPYFTRGFNKLREKYKDFDVVETGWPKLDVLFAENKVQTRKEDLKKRFNIENIILYAPTFSPSLTSAKNAFHDIFRIPQDKNKLLIIKFHDMMDVKVRDEYIKKAKEYENVIIHEGRSIIPLLVDADLMISDTSSAVYEFLLLDKPVITINTAAKSPKWLNVNNSSNIVDDINKTLYEDSFKEARKEIIREYHPYNDGRSSERVLDEITRWIDKNGIPDKRKLSLHRRLKIYKHFGLY